MATGGVILTRSAKLSILYQALTGDEFTGENTSCRAEQSEAKSESRDVHLKCVGYPRDRTPLGRGLLAL